VELADVRELIPGASIEHPTVGLRRALAPLLVKVGNAFGNTRVSNVPDPSKVTSTVSCTALSPDDCPIEAIKAELVLGTSKRFSADEANGSRHLTPLIRTLGRHSTRPGRGPGVPQRDPSGRSLTRPPLIRWGHRGDGEGIQP
jgi:hypothetical protein